jgi:hypothetical protein
MRDRLLVSYGINRKKNCSSLVIEETERQREKR